LAITAGSLFKGVNPFTSAASDSGLNHAIDDVTANNTIKLDAGEGDVTTLYEHGQHVNIHGSSGAVNDGCYHFESASFAAGQTTLIIEETTLNDAVDDGDVHYQTFAYWSYDNDTTTWNQINQLGYKCAKSIDVTYYNDITATGGDFVAITAQRYGTSWVYIEQDGHVHVVYGQGSYTLAQSIAVGPPASLPDVINKMGFLIAKVVFQKLDSSFTEIYYPWTTTFSATGATDHANLANLDWDVAGHVINTGLDMNSNALTEVSGITVDDGATIGTTTYKWLFDETNGDISTTADVAIGATGVTTGFKADIYGGLKVQTVTEGTGIELRNGVADSGDTLVKIYDSADDGIIDVYQNDAVTNRINGNGNSFFNGGNTGFKTTAPDGVVEINMGTSDKVRLSYNDANGSATDYTEFGVDSNGGFTITTVDGDGTAGHIILAPDGEIVAQADIQLGENDIKLDPVLSGDEIWSGITIVGVSGVTTLAVGDLCYLNANDSRWELVDANLSDGYDKQLGICVLAGADGAATEMLTYGKVRSAAFPAFTVGSPLYMSETAGDMTHTAPTTTDSATRIMGFAITAEDMLFAPEGSYFTHT